MIATDGETVRDEICKSFWYNVWKKCDEHRNTGGVSLKSRKGAPSRKGHVANGQSARANNKLTCAPVLTKINANRYKCPSKGCVRLSSQCQVPALKPRAKDQEITPFFMMHASLSKSAYCVDISP